MQFRELGKSLEAQVRKNIKQIRDLLPRLSMNKKILSKTNNSGLTIYVTHHEPNYMWRGAYSAQASDANAGHAIYIRLGEYVDPERELKPL